MKGLAICPHSSIKYWNYLGLEMMRHNSCFKLDGYTYVAYNKSDAEYFNHIYFINDNDLSRVDININNNIININNIISRDRWLRDLDYNKSIQICKNLYLIIKDILLREKYDFLIGEVSCATNELFLQISLDLKIPFYNITSSLYINKYYLYRAEDIFGNKNYIQKKICSNIFSDFKFKNINSEIITKLNVDNISNSYTNKSSKFKYLINILFLFKQKFTKKSIFIDHHNNFKTNIIAFIRSFYTKLNKKVNFIDNLNLNSYNYFLFFLHYEPDLSTYIWANNYMDQLHLLKIISINLPAETILIVKEHPLSANIRPTGFYDVIRSLPNVKLIYEGYSKKELILRSKGILTITGSIGYESWLLGKPVIVFGNVFFDNFKNVFDCKNFDLLFTTFCRLLKGDYNQLEESYKHKIDEFIFEKCTIDGNIFNYENKFNQLTIEDKINDMKSVFSFILNDINE